MAEAVVVVAVVVMVVEELWGLELVVVVVVVVVALVVVEFVPLLPAHALTMNREILSDQVANSTDTGTRLTNAPVTVGVTRRSVGSVPLGFPYIAVVGNRGTTSISTSRGPGGCRAGRIYKVSVAGTSS